MTPRTSALIGSAIGILAIAYFLIFLPMMGNYQECGKVTVCGK